MGKECLYCGQPLPLSRRLTRKNLHSECEKQQQESLFAYERTLRQAGRDRQLTQATKAELREIAAAGRFQDEQLQEANKSIYESLKEAILKHSDFTQGERDFLGELQAFFSLTDEEASAQELDHIREVVFIVEGNLPEIDSTVRLTRNEVAHFEGPATWMHLKTRRKRVAGSRAQSVRIAKGIRLRSNSTPGKTVEWEEFQPVSEGKVVVTSKRLLFVGDKKNFNVKLDKILDLELFPDAVMIYRGTVNPTYLFMDDVARFYAVLSTVLEDSEEPEEE
jgi:hypothetical protein